MATKNIRLFRNKTRKQLWFQFKPLSVAILFAFATQGAQANPIGPSVVNGQASFAANGNTLTVTNTPGAIINWQGFSIGANEITRFAQQSAASTVLNRVVTSNPSSILGALQSNGRVFLVNPNGIVFGQGATINVAGLVATTLNLSNADFLAGRYSFTQVPGAQNISNAGNITAQSGGQIYLIAPSVENNGIITAPTGEILLAAGNSVELVNSLDPNLRVNITAPAGNAINVGQLVASAGSLGLFGTVVRNSGAVSADSATMQGGKIVFKASLRAEVGGTVSATGTTGGAIQALGSDVQITAGATLDASGMNGGGTVLVGGDKQGANPNVVNAQNTYVDASAVIRADATQSGNGGKIIVWADNTTRAYGSLSARGGVNGGNGGFIETSGHLLDVQGIRANASAPKGISGTWLLDPWNVTIATAPSVEAGGVFAIGAWTPNATGSTILDTTIIAALNAGTAVTINTIGVGAEAGNITVNAPLAMTGATPISLILNAAGSIFINQPISSTTPTALSLVLNHGAAGNANLASSLTLAGGIVDVQSGGVTGTGTLNVTGGVSAIGALTAATLNLSGGTLNIDGIVNGGTTIANLSLSGTGILGGASAITIQGAAAAGVMTWTGGGLAGTGTLTLATGSTLNAPGVAGQPLIETILSLNKPVVLASGSTANFGSGMTNGHVLINVGTGGSALNSGTMNFDNATPVDVGGAGTFTNAGTVTIGPVNQPGPIAPIGNWGNVPASVPIVNNGGTFYFAASPVFSGPVTINGGSFIGATKSGQSIIPTTFAPFITFTGPLTISGGATLTLNNVLLDVFGATSQGAIGGGSASIVMDGLANIVNHGAWTMNSAVYSMTTTGLLAGFYNMPTPGPTGGSVTIPAGGTATFNAGVSFMNAGVLTQTGALTNNNSVNNINTGAMNVNTALAGHWTNNGTLNVTAGANFAGDITNTAIMTVTGAVTFQRSLFNSPTGTLSLTGATVSLGGGLFNGGIINMSGSTVNVCSGCPPLVQRADYEIFGNKGTLNVTGTNTTNFFGVGLGGLVKGTAVATDILNVTTEIGFDGAATLDTVTVNTASTMVMGMNKIPSPSTLTLQNGAIVNNGGTWNLFNGDAINVGAGAAPAFNNLAGGILQMNDLLAGIGATFNAPLNNSGSLNVVAGTLNLNGAYSGTGAITIDGSQLISLLAPPGVLNVNVPMTVQTLNLTTFGTLGGSGTVTIPVGGVMNMTSPSNTAVDLVGKTLINNGTVNQGTTTAFTDLLMTNAVVNNNGTWNIGYFTYLVDTSLAAPLSVFNNFGTLNINPQPLSSLITVALNNTGTVNVNGPTTLTGGGSLGGVFNLAAQLTVGVPPNAVVYPPGTTPVAPAPAPITTTAPVIQQLVSQVTAPLLDIMIAPPPAVAPIEDNKKAQAAAAAAASAGAAAPAEAAPQALPVCR